MRPDRSPVDHLQNSSTSDQNWPKRHRGHAFYAVRSPEHWPGAELYAQILTSLRLHQLRRDVMIKSAGATRAKLGSCSSWLPADKWPGPPPHLFASFFSSSSILSSLFLSAAACLAGCAHPPPQTPGGCFMLASQVFTCHRLCRVTVVSAASCII